nr:DNA repair protein RecN [Acidimicrobiia bacterium]
VPGDTADPAGERVELLLSANPGSPLLPLSKVASGGELARTMLALRLVLAGLDEPGEGERTLVFDEVDAGIGGTAATAVGEALATLAQRHQVLVVTHLAQVATQATTQLAVSKEIVGDATFAHVEAVDGGRRVDEIARMLSGEDGGEAARRHAGELLDRS